jgi:hypothetical protein
MGKQEDGHILRPAVVTSHDITSGFLMILNTLNTGKTSKVFAVLLKYCHGESSVSLKVFDKRAIPELCSTYSFSDLSPTL